MKACNQEKLFTEKNDNPEKKSFADNAGSTLAIASYNVVTELEYLQNYKEALNACKNGFDNCSKILGPTHNLCLKLSDLLSNIEKHKEVKQIFYFVKVPRKKRKCNNDDKKKA